MCQCAADMRYQSYDSIQSDSYDYDGIESEGAANNPSYDSYEIVNYNNLSDTYSYESYVDSYVDSYDSDAPETAHNASHSIERYVKRITCAYRFQEIDLSPWTDDCLRIAMVVRNQPVNNISEKNVSSIAHNILSRGGCCPRLFI